MRYIHGSIELLVNVPMMIILFIYFFGIAKIEGMMPSFSIALVSCLLFGIYKLFVVGHIWSEINLISNEIYFWKSCWTHALIWSVMMIGLVVIGIVNRFEYGEEYREFIDAFLAISSSLLLLCCMCAGLIQCWMEQSAEVISHKL